MTCKQTIKLTALKSGLLTATEEAALAAHLKSCPDCGRAKAVFEKVDRSLRTLPLRMAPVNFEKKVMSAVRRTDTLALRIRRFVAGLELTAAVLTAGALSAALYFISTPAFGRLLEIIGCMDFNRILLSLYYTTQGYAVTLIKVGLVFLANAPLRLPAMLAVMAVSLGVVALSQFDKKLHGSCI